MKNPIVLLGIAVVVLLGIGGFFVFQNSSTKEPAMVNDESMMKEDSMMEKSDESSMMNDDGHHYVEYSKSAFDSNSSMRRVLFFYANWCPTCRPTDEDLTANSSKIPEDVTVIRVNYKDDETDEDEKSLAEKYGITYQHTFVQIDQNGEQVTKWNGGNTDELLSNIK